MCEHLGERVYVRDRGRKEEVYVFKAEAFVVDAVLWKLWAPSSVI